MNVLVELATPRGHRDFAQTRLTVAHDLATELNIDAVTLRTLGPVARESVQDLLLVAATVYAIDRLVKRERAADFWTREFDVKVPVSDPETWTEATSALERCLSFLTGDIWTFKFTKRNVDLWTPKHDAKSKQIQTVSLFSGGIDSLIGVVNHLVGHPEQRMLLVGHRDPRIRGTHAEQRRLYQLVEEAYPKRTLPLFAFIGATSGLDTSLRSRSFLFLALGVLAASTQAHGTPLLIPENGMIALNPPLTPSRRGSLSTRTAHPHYLQLYRKLLEAVGITTPVVNPLAELTKGEAVSTCLNLPFLETAALATISCAKQGHTRWWHRKGDGVNQCGQCMPCIYRRAALHAAGLDSEVYGNNICTGEVDPTGISSAANDLRSLLNFLDDNPSQEDVEDLLFANGTLPERDLPMYAGMVLRAMDEVRALLRDKATPEVKRFAGLDAAS